MMNKIGFSKIMDKYGDTIKEEINIKELDEMDKSLKIAKIYKPLGNKLSGKFGKDTGRIIQFGKSGNIKDIGDEKIVIFDNEGNERILEKEDYEIAYEGIEGENMAIDGNIIAKMDLDIDEDLQREGVAREISRFLNQMRKDANFNVDDKVRLDFLSDDRYLNEVLDLFDEFLCKEALLSGIKKISKKPEGNIVAEFAYEDSTALFALIK